MKALKGLIYTPDSDRTVEWAWHWAVDRYQFIVTVPDMTFAFIRDDGHLSPSR